MSEPTFSYAELPVPDSLRPHVRAVWHLQAGALDGNATVADPIIPDGCTEIVLNCGDAMLQHDAGASAAQPRLAVVAGQWRPTVVTPTGTMDIWGIRLQPWSAGAFLDARIADLQARTESLDDVTGTMGRALRVAMDSDPSSRGAHLMAALTHHARTVPAPDTRAVALARHAISEMHDPGVRAIAAWSGLGVRQVQRVFAGTIGIPPKLLMRLGRFQRALVLARAGERSWAAIAANSGYYDQSHLARDCRQFAGTTLSQLFGPEETLTELFAGIG